VDTERVQYPYVIGGPGVAINLNHVTHARREGDNVRVFFAVAALNEHGLATTVLTGDQAEDVARELCLDLESMEY
jgi:hypothetical protein